MDDDNRSAALAETRLESLSEPSLRDAPRTLAASERGGPHAPLLSRREIHVLEYIKEGFKNPEIGTALKLSTKTVENHVRNILLKLGVKNRTQAVVQALRKSIISF